MKYTNEKTTHLLYLRKSQSKTGLKDDIHQVYNSAAFSVTDTFSIKILQ